MHQAPPQLGDLFPDDVSSGAAWITDQVDALIGGEARAIERAVASRRHEYATGRVLARRLLEARGHVGVALEREDESRLPRWPRGVVGSISHADALCVAAVAERARYVGIGIDLEPDQPTDREIERAVLRDAEHDWVGAAGDDVERRRRTRVVFSAKEAVYKAFYPSVREIWSFQDVGVEMDLDRSRFRAALPPGAGREAIEGRLLRREGWILSSVAIPVGEADPR